MRVLLLASVFCVAGPALASEDAGVPTEELVTDDLDLLALLRSGAAVESVTGARESVQRAPAAVTVIDREWIAALGFQSVAEVLEVVPGLFVSTDYTFHDVAVRGVGGELRGRARAVKVMIDGQSTALRDSATNLLGPELIPLSAVERIEVIRGPASALYGANAFFGVINIVTRDQVLPHAARVGLTGSLFGDGRPGVSTEASLSARAGPLEVLLATRVARLDRSGLRLPCGTTFGGGDAACDAQRAQSQDPGIYDRVSRDDLSQPASFIGRLGLDLGEAFSRTSDLGRVELEVSHSRLDSRANFGDWAVLASTPEGRSNRVALAQTWGRLRLIGPAWGRLKLWGSVTLAQGGVADGDEMLDPVGPGLAKAGRSRAGQGFLGIDASLSASVKLLEAIDVGRGDGKALRLVDDLSVLLTVDGASDELVYPANSLVQPFEVRRGQLRELGVLGQLTASLFARRLGLVAGLRWDGHQGLTLTEDQLARALTAGPTPLCGTTVCYTRTSGRVGATGTLLRDVGELNGHAVLDELTLKVLYGTAFKAPPPEFLYADEALGQVPVRPNPGLKPETLQSGEVIVGASLLGGALGLTAGGYRAVVQDFVIVAPVMGGVKARNVAAISTWGLEVTADARFAPLELRASFSRQWAERDVGTRFGGNIPETIGVPRFSGSAAAVVSISPLRSTVAGVVRFWGERTGSPLNGRGDLASAAYLLPPGLAVDLTWRTRPLRLLGPAATTTFAFKVRNLFDTRSAQPGFQPYFGTDLPGEPRTLLLTVEQEL